MEALPSRSGSVTRRLIYALALVPIVPAISAIGATYCSGQLKVASFDENRWFHLFFPCLWVLGTVLIWRSMVLWTLGRRWLTILISFIPFVQVVYGQPLWDAGCVNDDMLRIGQHQIGISGWVWLSMWVWWSWERIAMCSDASQGSPRPTQMTPTAKRLVASLATVPFLFGAFLIIAVILDDLMGLTDPVPETFALTALVAVTTWIFIWRKSVAWSRDVVRVTGLATLPCLVLPILAQFFFWNSRGGGADVALATGPVIGWGVWMVATTSFWPMTQLAGGDVAVTPRCLQCGYLLTGLRATRCPECGDEPTIDELWMGTTGAIDVEVPSRS